MVNYTGTLGKRLKVKARVVGALPGLSESGGLIKGQNFTNYNQRKTTSPNFSKIYAITQVA